ncbi:hypothetical protein CLOBY_27690 [Clostridium saccharobutylicum]|uniref:Lipoprotein n=1 Tax=Clostridium saccharobutylicum DSM 13864 TaxID=1345695 RepID=U5MS98_CLOSA|nr:hypothetical protein [Clostridium saccharobutylicum]AGX43684.1 hypothetical protein CLSA_c27130 [Clostridium saccharobutylicum DSM 13864]AQR90982.1 hypothetical protein CLOSC_27030 [Clostridium saccharobutylicum]AQS00886.1 hypothetical protein CSACC_27100 [Clostridium saccharobutylicum]AQS10624.1 hypothetical protein CLOBY_27690 [Clostridium saccharobutylicum]AQS14869.1 hypothetical protein CLOSACC_27100 [Clostridium saccharobutylicum]
MMSFKRWYLSILAFIVFPLLILGCSSSVKDEKVPNAAEDIKLNSGAVLKSEDGNYKVYNYDNGQYNLANTDNVILAYDKNSSSYICIQNEKPFVIHNGQRFCIKDEGYSELKLSPEGGYISYFVDDNGLKLKIFKTSDNNQVEIKSEVSISGTLYDWYDSDTLVYYGVSNDGINGLFTYNIKEGQEKLLYKVKEGYLAYLKGTNDNVLFLQLTLDNNRQLMMIDKKTKDTKMLTDKIQELSDIIVNKDKIYFTGKALNNVNSLYEIKDNKPKRLVFDFPAKVDTKKGLAIDKNGSVLFVGVSGEDSSDEEIYAYSQDGSVSSISKKSVDYVFLNYRN